MAIKRQRRRVIAADTEQMPAAEAERAARVVGAAHGNKEPSAPVAGSIERAKRMLEYLHSVVEILSFGTADEGDERWHARIAADVDRMWRATIKKKTATGELAMRFVDAVTHVARSTAIVEPVAEVRSILAARFPEFVDEFSDAQIRRALDACSPDRTKAETKWSTLFELVCEAIGSTIQDAEDFRVEHQRWKAHK